MSTMLKEILEAPDVVREVIRVNKGVLLSISKEFKERGITNITTVARGTSDNAATYFKYIAEAVGGFMVSKFAPSVATIYDTGVNLKNNMVLAISQSGMSTDTLTVVEKAKRTGALIVCMTNNANSPLAKLSDYHINLSAGEEVSVPATKTFTAQLSALYLLANKLSDSSAKMNLLEIPHILEDFIKNNSGDLRAFAKRVNSIQNFVVLSRGIMLPIATEFSLKIMETCYRFNRPFSTTDFVHGPISLVEEGFPVIMLAPGSEFSQEYINMATRLNLLGANIIAFTDIKEVEEIATQAFTMQPMRGMETPFVYTLAIQLFTYYFAESLGINPDKPRSLNKVTITV
ncbi:MAG: SIS domain-containing protein [Firmicutes bacterium]|nr:SIS domain-containing protein [Bacillota bacterium]